MAVVVWFKRDLRIYDHAALNAAVARAAELGVPVVPLYVVEPEYWALPDASGRHWDTTAEGLEELRPRPVPTDRMEAWANGQTGWPFVDACMRHLRATGWLNLRMRAMLISVASYQLWMDWRESGVVLARLFTDYEPGIHWPMIQMQSGTNPFSVPRIYNRSKNLSFSCSVTHAAANDRSDASPDLLRPGSAPPRRTAVPRAVRWVLEGRSWGFHLRGFQYRRTRRWPHLA